jgi:hypothetical protein
MYDRLLNYLVFKILFVGAVLEPDLKELVVWATWFSLIGFLRVFSMLARDRFEYLTFSPTTPFRTHVCATWSLGYFDVLIPVLAASRKCAASGSSLTVRPF